MSERPPSTPLTSVVSPEGGSAAIATLPMAAIPTEQLPITSEPGRDLLRRRELGFEAGKLSLPIAGVAIDYVALGVNKVQQAMTGHALRRDEKTLERRIDPDLALLRTAARQALESTGTNPDFSNYAHERPPTTFRQNLLKRRMLDQRHFINEEERERENLSVRYGEPILKPGKTHRRRNPRPVVPGSRFDIGGNLVERTQITFAPEESPYVREVARDPSGKKRTTMRVQTDGAGIPVHDEDGPVMEEVDVTEQITDIGTPEYVARVEAKYKARKISRSERNKQLKARKDYLELGHELHARRALLESSYHAGEPGHGHVPALREHHKLRHPIKTVTLRNFRKVAPARQLVNDKFTLERRVDRHDKHWDKLEDREDEIRNSIATRKATPRRRRRSRTMPRISP
jgi:hypothetical protein